MYNMEQSLAEQSRAEQSRAEQSRFDSLDGLRVIAALFIIAMHIYSNFGATFNSVVFSPVISSFGNLTILFMMVSGFSMCCGYYKKIMGEKISIVKFYEKRYAKVLPFFALITIIDLIFSLSLNSIYEGFANMTLTFGLLPNANIQVIGVGWTLGTIFVFYIIFPFFCYLIKDKRTAWFSLVISIVYHVLCGIYFFNENHLLEGYWGPQNIIYCGMFFITGGLIYLYRESLARLVKKHHILALIGCLLITIVYYIRPQIENGDINVVVRNISGLILFSAWLIYALDSNNVVLNNRLIKFLSGISFEIYLSHMLIFRVLEKIGAKYLFGKSILSYIVIYALTVVLTIVFATVAQWFLKHVNSFFKEKICRG